MCVGTAVLCGDHPSNGSNLTKRVEVWEMADFFTLNASRVSSLDNKQRNA